MTGANYFVLTFIVWVAQFVITKSKDNTYGEDDTLAPAITIQVILTLIFIWA